MHGHSMFIGYRACAKNAYCPCCGEYIENRGPLAPFVLIGVPRVVCQRCFKSLSPELAEVMAAMRGRGRDIADGRPDPSGLTTVRECVCEVVEAAVVDSPYPVVEVSLAGVPKEVIYGLPVGWDQPSDDEDEDDE